MKRLLLIMLITAGCEVGPVTIAGQAVNAKVTEATDAGADR